MAASPLQLDLGLAWPALSTSFLSSPVRSHMGEFVPDSSKFEILSYPVMCRYCESDSVEEGMRAQELHDALLQEFLGDPTKWWDKTRSHFNHKFSKVPLWLNNRHKPSWMDLQLGTLEAGMKMPPEPVVISVEGQGAIESLGPHEGCKKVSGNGQISEAVDALHSWVQQGCHVPSNLFYHVLKRCIVHNDLVVGRRIHALTIESGYEGDAFLATHLISLYASHGRLEEAMQVFTRVSTPDSYNWAAIIFAYARHGEAAHAIHLYRQLLRSTNIQPDNRLYVAVLKACATAGDLAAGKEVHARILVSPGKPDSFVQTSLVDMYAKCRSLEDAREVFDGLPTRNVATWNALLAGYAHQGMGQEALCLYSLMQQEPHAPPNSVTYVCILQACTSIGVGALDQGKQLHAQIEERGLQVDLVLGGSLVNMYVKCGSLEDAHRVFDRLPKRDMVTWTALITGYTMQGMGQEALTLYNNLQHEDLKPPDSVTYACLLQACASVGVGALDQGVQLHADIEERGLQDDLVLGGSLVNMYAKCGSLGNARRVFDRLPDKNVVTWTALIAGYTQQGMCQEALSLFSSMQQEGLNPPDSVAYTCLLHACACVGVGALEQGKKLHAEIERRGRQEDLVWGGSLVNMYAKCGSLGDAHCVFDRLPERDVVTWTALIGGYVQQGMGQEALGLYSTMQQENCIAPNSATYACLLKACASVAALPLGKQLHAEIEARGLQADVFVGAGLVNMYAKCGSMVDSLQVFDSLPERSIEAWNAVTSGYARQGNIEFAFDLVDRMRLEGLQPNSITFLCLLKVCSHVGEVDKGRKHFEAMKLDYGISPTIEHYTCMVDLLGRAGHLDEALQLVKTMPFLPDITVWHTLLGACRKWKNVEVGQEAFEFAVADDGQNAASYVLMSNIYASAEMWEGAKQMQARRVKAGAWKDPGQSWWTDMAGVVHMFVTADKKRLESESINAKAGTSYLAMEKAGYMPHLALLLRSMPDDE